MKFRRIHVDGYGIWKDLDLPDLSPGLNVFLAPNEGGKSTLMAFIRAVLFGFKRRGDTRRYAPLHGGSHGGFLEVETGGSTYRIARSKGQSSRGDVEVTDADGKQLSAAKLDSLLQNTTETLYENVFAFGLEELQRLDTLHAEDVAGHIYAAGMGSGSLSPVAFRSLMQESMESLYRPRGKKQPLAKLMAEIEADEERLGKLRQHPEEHAEVKRQHDRTHERLLQHNEALEQRQLEFDTARRAQQAWPDYEKLLRAEATLETIGVTSTKLRRAATAVSAQAGAEPTATATAVALAENGTVEIVTPQLDPLELMSTAQRELLWEATKIRGLMATSSQLESLHATVVQRMQHARELRHALFNDLEELGPTWSLERIRGARTDVEARDEIRQWTERLQRAETEIDRTDTRAADANLVYQTLQESREQISRGTLLVSWCLILLGIALTALLVPAQARLASTASMVAVGALLGVLVTWLHTRGLRLRRSERSIAAEREAGLWHEHETAKDGFHDVQGAWRGWLAEQHLPTDMSTQGTLDLLDRIRQTQAMDLTATEAEAAVTSAKGELQQACMNVLALFDDLGRPVDGLRYDVLKMVGPLSAEIESLQAELDDVEQHRERIRNGLDEHAQARAALNALAAEEGPVRFRERLESWDAESLARAVGESQGHLGSAKADRDAVNENLGALREQLRSLEGDDTMANLLVVRESRRAALAQILQQWSAHAVAATLYDAAKGKYESERQPEVLRQASRYLGMMTDGLYSRVIAPLGESRLEVERSHSGERLAPEALSRGTGEQLYLAMRLALAKVYGAEAVPLPLVADDILVNFDDDRARATASLLATYAAEGHQILAFTCHRHLIDTFEKHAPDAFIQPLPAHS